MEQQLNSMSRKFNQFGSNLCKKANSGLCYMIKKTIFNEMSEAELIE